MSLSRKSFLLSGATLPLGALLAACGSTSSTSGGAQASSGNTITHALGTTEIPAEVSRIASVNWANQDVALALGIMPVGFLKYPDSLSPDRVTVYYRIGFVL